MLYSCSTDCTYVAVRYMAAIDQSPTYVYRVPSVITSCPMSRDQQPSVHGLMPHGGMSQRGRINIKSPTATRVMSSTFEWQGVTNSAALRYRYA
jgi:hypothetical protein